jgi:peptidoglycan/xylan/chitin deacetylase (PgdA/CDA1 family)
MPQRALWPPCLTLNFHRLAPPGSADLADPYTLPVPAFATLCAGIRQATAAGRRIAVTFDDGFASDLAFAAPLLREHGIADAQFFIVAGWIGRPGHLDTAGLHALAEAGFGLGTHGHAHADYAALPAPAIRADLAAAIAAMDAVGLPRRALAIPFGRYDRTALRVIAGFGFEAVYNSDGGLSLPARRLRPRLTVTQRTDPGALAARLQAPPRPHRLLPPLLREWRKRARSH